MSRFVESIKLMDGVFFRLSLHQQRINQVFADHFPSHPIPELTKLLSDFEIPQKGLFKCRIVFDSEIRSVQFEQYVRREIHCIKVVETDIETLHYKTEERGKFQEAFAKRDGCDDVLLIRNGLITDCSYSNLALYNGEKWITPRIPLIYGVNRAMLLSEGKIYEDDINISDLSNFQAIRLFNAMIEFGEIQFNVNTIKI